MFLELKARFKKVLQTIPSTSVILNTEMSVSDLHEKLGFFTQLWAFFTDIICWADASRKVKKRHRRVDGESLSDNWTFRATP